MTTKPIGPKYRVCQGCFTRPSHGVVTTQRAGAMFFVHVCDRCIPNEGTFEVYRPPCDVCQVIHTGPGCR